MDDETPAPPQKPSKVPSWVTLGFALGALFILALPKSAPVEPALHPAPTAVPARPVEGPRLPMIDAVFESWGQYAVWSDGTTEVALWDSATKSFSDLYEVVKVGDDFYFRPISRLTRPVLTHGVPEGSPLQFTETERQREEWLGEVRKENLKAFTGAQGQPADAPLAKKPDGG